MPRCGGIRVGIGLREQHHEAGAQPVRRPHLLAGDHVVVAVANGCRANRLYVRSRMRLRHRVRGAQLASRHARQILPPLILGAVAVDHPGGQEVRVQHAGQRHPPARELDLDEHVRREIEPQAAVLLGDDDPEEPEPLHLLDERLWELRPRARARRRTGSPRPPPTPGWRRRSRSVRRRSCRHALAGQQRKHVTSALLLLEAEHSDLERVACLR